MNARGKREKLALISVKRKGFDLALEAVAQARMYVDSYTIFGEGPEKQALERRIESLNLTQIVKLAGWSSDLESIYQEADLMLIPSLWEGLCLVAVESLSTGLPTFASDIDGLKEVIPNKSFLLPRRADVWANAIMSFFQKGSDVPIKEMVRHAERFSIFRMAKEYQSIYEKVYK